MHNATRVRPLAHWCSTTTAALSESRPVPGSVTEHLTILGLILCSSVPSVRNYLQQEDSKPGGLV